VLPNDLIQGISLRALGASVPGQDMTARVEHEDGVVSDAFDQQSEALLARLDRLAVWPGGEELGITNAKRGGNDATAYSNDGSRWAAWPNLVQVND